MSISLDAILAGLLMLAQQDPVVVSTGPHFVNTRYHSFDYESACGPHVFQVRFRNGPEENGRVDYLLIDGRPVRDAAETLQIRAARRSIEKINIMHCGTDPQRPTFVGTLKMGVDESRSVAMRHDLPFRLTLRDGKGWQITVD